MRPHGSTQELERRRRRAVAMVQGGQSRAHVARALGVGSGTVTRWWQAYERKGDDGLAAKRHPGPKPKLSAYRRRLLGKRLLKGARGNGFSTDLWSCQRSAISCQLSAISSQLSAIIDTGIVKEVDGL